MVVEWCAAANCVPIATAMSAPMEAIAGNLIKTLRRSSSSLWRNDVSPGMTRDLDKDMVSVRVDPLGIIALQAHAFHDVEFSRPLTKEDACGLPRRGQDMGSQNLEIVMQDVGLRQMHSLDDFHVAVVGNAHSLAHRQISLRQNVHGLHDQRVALPMADGMAMECELPVIGMGAAIGIDTPQPVAVGFAEDADPARREQKLHGVVGHEHP